MINGAHGVQRRARSKHIDVRYMYVQEQVSAKKIDTFWVNGTENRADLNTKPLANVTYFNRLRDSLHVMDSARFKV